MKTIRFVLRNEGIKRNAQEVIHNLPTDGTPYELVIKKWQKPRSDSQHGYYRVLQGILSEDSGWELTEIHDHMRDKAGLYKRLKLPNGKTVEVLMSTNEMSVIQMGELIEATLRSGAQEFEINLPAPKDVAA